MVIWGCSYISYKQNSTANIKFLNEELRKIAANQKIKLIDTYSLFVDNSGEPIKEYFTPDGIHLSKQGYDIWITKGLQPFLHSNQYSSIGMVGNSITEGVEEYHWDKNSTFESNWELHLGRNAKNFGIGGNISQEVLDRLDTILEYKRDCYFLMIGINDINRGVPIWQTVENIEKIVKTVLQNESDLILQLVLPVVE